MIFVVESDKQRFLLVALNHADAADDIHNYNTLNSSRVIAEIRQINCGVKSRYDRLDIPWLIRWQNGKFYLTTEHAKATRIWADSPHSIRRSQEYAQRTKASRKKGN